jgi:hypothetical protein
MEWHGKAWLGKARKENTRHGMQGNALHGRKGMAWCNVSNNTIFFLNSLFSIVLVLLNIASHHQN